MPAQIAYNLDDLDARQILQKIRNSHDAVAAHAATFVTPNPALANALTAHDAAETLLNDIDTKERDLETLRSQRDTAMEAAVLTHRTLGSYVETIAAGNPAIIAEGGYDVAQPRGATPTMTKVQNNVVTSGDNDGDADAAWDALKGAKSYELQTAAAATGPWTHHATVTVSRAHITGQTSGQKLWTQVRAVNKLGPGPWSDPACCTVP